MWSSVSSEPGPGCWPGVVFPMPHTVLLLLFPHTFFQYTFSCLLLSLPPPGLHGPGVPQSLLFLSCKMDLGCGNVPQLLEQFSCMGPSLASLEHVGRRPASRNFQGCHPGPSVAEGGTGGVPGPGALTAPWQGAAPASWRVSQAVRSCLSGSVHPDDVQVAKVDAFLVLPGATGTTPWPQVGAACPSRWCWVF